MSTVHCSKQKKYKIGHWSTHENERFEKSILKHGRDWPAISNDVRTRSRKQVSKKAARYFMALLRDGKPLPPKVEESGTGYTCSGAPLNAYSGSAVEFFGCPEKVPLRKGSQIFSQCS